MLRFLLRRATLSVPLLLLLPGVLFTLIHAAPGSVVDAIIGDYPVPPAYRAQLTAMLGLNRPFGDQLLTYYHRALTLNFGYSYANGAPVSDLVWGRLGATLILVVPALLLSSVIGLVLGSIAGHARSVWGDNVINGSALVSLAVPSFWLAQILIIVFSIHLGWFPSIGMVSARRGGSIDPGDLLWHLILPLTALTFLEFGAVTRVTRASTLEVVGMDYITTAQMKGLTPRQIRWRHVLRNASLPAITIIGTRFGRAVAGSILIETVFAWPGMGLLLFNSIEQRENQVLLAIVMMIGFTVVVANLITDFVYGLIDPRIRHV
jgi:peptide/nickel transport system permease protein